MQFLTHFSSCTSDVRGGREDIASSDVVPMHYVMVIYVFAIRAEEGWDGKRARRPLVVVANEFKNPLLSCLVGNPD